MKLRKSTRQLKNQIRKSFFMTNNFVFRPDGDDEEE